LSERIAKYEKAKQDYNADKCAYGKLCKTKDKLMDVLTDLFFDDSASALVL
jgi:hypothetical protein